MVREFKLINEKGQEYSLMDIYNYCLLTEPEGLGYSYNTEYEQLGNSFISSLRMIEQGQIGGQVNFINYDNYRNFINYIESSEELKFGYKIPYEDGTFKEYFKDIEIQEITKTQKKNNSIISESIIFDCLTLWYEEEKTSYSIIPQSDEIRWNFRWNSRFYNYNSRSLQYINKGHVEAPIQLSINGNVVNPVIKLYVEGQLYQTITINATIGQYEIFLYDSREGHFYIGKQNANGTKSSLFNLNYLDFDEDLVMRLPKNKSCEIRLEADNNISSADLTILPQYKAV